MTKQIIDKVKFQFRKRHENESMYGYNHHKLVAMFSQPINPIHKPVYVSNVSESKSLIICIKDQVTNDIKS